MQYKYKVLMIYNQDDSEYVENNIYPQIRSSVQGESFCVSSESLPAGSSMPEEMTRLMKRSRRVVALISDHFVSDPWCLLQFNLAMAEKLRDSSPKLLGLCISIIDI